MRGLLAYCIVYCYTLISLPVKADNPAKNYHPLHVSTTDISLNKQTHHLEVVCTIFTDDFELALAKKYKTKTDLSAANMHTAMDKLVADYINQNVHIKANTPVKLNYVGFEKVKESVNVYFESDDMPAIRKIAADVSLLYNLYDDQMNIVHITVNGTRKSTRLDCPDTHVEQVF